MRRGAARCGRAFAFLVMVALPLACGDEDSARTAANNSVPDAERRQLELFWTHFRAATEARVAGNLREASERYRLALEHQAGHEDALYYLGNVEFQLGRHRDAEEVWRRLIQVNPGSARAHLQLGTLYACPDRRGFFRPLEAEAALQRAMRINQEQTGPLLRLAMVKLAQGENAAADGLAAAVLRTNGRSIEGHLVRGLVAWRGGIRPDAVRHLAAAREAAQPEEQVGGVAGEGDARPGTRLWEPTTGCPGPDAALVVARELPDLDDATVATLYQRLDGSLRSPR